MNDLGAPERRYVRGRAHATAGLGCGGLLLGAALLMIPLSRTPSLGAVWWILLVNGILLGAVGLGVARRALRHRDLALAVHERGFVWTERGEARAYRWEQVEALDGTGRRRGILVDGRRLPLEPLPSAPDAAERVAGHVFPRLLAEAEQRLEAGEPVRFGELLVTPDAVSLGAERVPLDRIAQVEVGPSWTRLVGPDGALVLGAPTPVVCNVEVLIAVLERRIGR